MSIFCSGISNPEVSQSLTLGRMENVFKEKLPKDNIIVYTKVPRGLIISFEDKTFFNCGEARIKESSLNTLNILVDLLNKFPNYCIVEAHTNEKLPECSEYKKTWEISIARASNIAEYMVMCQNLSLDRIFPFGFGNMMPFAKNVTHINKQIDEKMNNRIDFVIIEYDTKR